jgi:hypothetical protein
MASLLGFLSEYLILGKSEIRLPVDGAAPVPVSPRIQVNLAKSRVFSRLSEGSEGHLC